MKVSNLEKVNLVGNRLLITGALAILGSINSSLKELNMSENPLNARKGNKAKEASIARKTPTDLMKFESMYTNKDFIKTPVSR